MPPHRSDSRAAGVMKMSAVSTCTRFRVIDSNNHVCLSRNFESKWTNFRRLQLCGIRKVGLEPTFARVRSRQHFPPIGQPFQDPTLNVSLQPSFFMLLPHTTHWLLAQCAKPNWDRWSRTTAYTDTRPSPISLLATQLLSVRCEELNLYLKPRKFASCL